MLDTNVEFLLQEIATELAFLAPGQPQGLQTVVDALERLGDLPALRERADVQQALSASLDSCQQALRASPLGQPELDHLQSSHERLLNCLYQLTEPTQAPAAAHEGAPVPAPEPAPEPPSKPVTDGQLKAQESGSFSIAPGDDLEFLNEFCNEGRDLLGQVEQGVLVLEEHPAHKDTLNQVFRAFHTFKGGAAFLGIEPIKELAHELESLLDAARRGELAITRAVIDVILAGADALRQYVDAIAQQLGGLDLGQPIAVPTAALLEQVQACLRGQVDNGTGTPRAEPAPGHAVPDRPADTGQTAPPAPELPSSPGGVAPQNQIHPVPEPGAPRTPARQEGLASFVKLDTRKLDALVDLVGELVIAQSMVVQHPQVQERRDRELERHLRQLSRITTDLQHNAMSLRMVPIRSAFQKMSRLVRDLAASQNKQVQLHLSGEETELDRNIVEELADPLLHMMRNAVDHGIESPAEREHQGKSAQGNIYLHAAHQGGGILIRMRDDGKGLDSQKILAKAIQRGLISPDSAPGEKDIYNLIFLPGFSTAETITDVSGRGVGMDVVRGSINRLRGRIDIDSVPGQGTTFDIFLPLTLAIIDGMLVGIGQERFILPTLAIRESLRPQAGMVSTVQGKDEVISVRNKLIPLVRLSDKLGIPGAVQDPGQGIVMVVDSGARTRAFLVDSLIGKQEVVIKSLGETFKHHKGMSGAAIMGDGRVALIVDPDAISQLPDLNPHNDQEPRMPHTRWNTP